MQPTIMELAEIAYALSDIFGTDIDLDEQRAAYLLNLFGKVSNNRQRPFELTSTVFVEDWNLSRKVFFGPAAIVPLEESLYKSWTARDGHPLKGMTGLAWGDPAIHIHETLSSFGIDFDPMRSSSPDHLAVILEFVGFLLETEKFDVVSSFSIDHLDWLDVILNRVIDSQLGICVQEPIEAAIALREVIISLN